MARARFLASIFLALTCLAIANPQAQAVDGDNATYDRYGVFNGTSTYAASTERVIPDGDFTLESWIRPDAIPTTSARSDNFMIIAGQGQNGGGCFTGRLYFGLHRDTGNNRYQVHVGYGLCNAGDANFFTTTSIPAESWSHIAMVFDKTNGRIIVYLNGSSIHNQAFSLGNVANDLFTVGSTDLDGGNSNRNHFFLGRIDQVKVWQGALTATEIGYSMYSLGINGSIDNNLIAVYDFNEWNSSSYLIDRSSYSTNATLTAWNLSLLAKADPPLSWANVTKTYGDGAYTVTAPTNTYGVSGSFTYSSSDISKISISGSTFTVGNAGTATITASFWPTDNNYSWRTITQTVTVNQASQTITLTALGTSSKTYPYSQVLSMAKSGGTGGGAITYSISPGGTASSCSLSNSSATATISATTSGTCLVVVNVASSTNYAAATSSALTFTFSKASQSPLALSSTSGNYGTPIALTTTGGTGTGAISYSIVAGGSASGCAIVNTDSLTSTTSGTCQVAATKATDVNYLVTSTSTTIVTISAGITTTTITLAPGNLVYRQSKSITIVGNSAGKISVQANKKNLPGCRNLVINAGNSYTRVCNYSPSTRGRLILTISFVPTDTSYQSKITEVANLFVYNRSGNR